MASPPKINIYSQEWTTLRDYIQSELSSEREKLESPDKTPDEYNKIRGRIEAYKYILGVETTNHKRNLAGVS